MPQGGQDQPALYRARLALVLERWEAMFHAAMAEIDQLQREVGSLMLLHVGRVTGPRVGRQPGRVVA